MSPNQRGALFVCLGNICRSPIAEAVFIHLLKQKDLSSQWFVDSAGTGGWHSGNHPDSRATSTLSKHNVNYDKCARQLEQDDFFKFDYIFGMDHDNIKELKRKTPPGSKAKILLLGDFDPEGENIIKDPYYDSGSEGFEKCYQQCLRSCNGFLNSLQ